MPDRMKTFIYILLSLIFIVLLFDIKLPKKTISPNPTPLPRTEVKTPEKPVRVPTSAEYLQDAKKSIKEGVSDSSLTSLWDAHWKLRLIEPAAPGYKEAQRLLKEVHARQKTLLAKDDAETEKTTAAIRKEYAKELEFTYLDKLHMDTTVTVSGNNNATIKIKWILWSRVSVHVFLKDETVLSQWREMGFKRYVLDGGYGGTWSDSL